MLKGARRESKTVSIGLRRHRRKGRREDVRVTSVSVGNELGKEGSLVVGGPLLGEPRGLEAGEDVHTVDLDTGNDVSPLEVLGVHRRSLSRGSHTVLVVLAGENDREVPELGLQGGKRKRDKFSEAPRQIRRGEEDVPCCKTRRPVPGWRHRLRTWRR